MKYNKLKAFTLAEIMVLLLTLSILLAAFAPVFTRRYQNVSNDDVWTFVAGDQGYSAYFDVPNKIFINSAFVGLNPTNSDDVLTHTKDSKSASANVIYSKLIVAASKKLGSTFAGSPPQNQMQFRYGNSAAGSLVGSLYAGNNNFIVGGPYKSIEDTAKGNSAFGVGALEDLSSGEYNTALGNLALKSVTTGKNNTSIGYAAGESLTSGTGNTLIGSEAGRDMSLSSNYNTLVGYNAGYSVLGSGNTAVGFRALEGEASDGNTAVGAYALNTATGKYNTAVGSMALGLMESGNYNTAVGSNSCLFINDNKKISKITCIGANSASTGESLPTANSSDSNVPDRVFIGTTPVSLGKEESGERTGKPYAVVEVHNSVSSPNSNLSPIPNGDESVIINGNLIVRGLPYFETPVFRQIQKKLYGDSSTVPYQNPLYAPKGLVMYKLYKMYGRNLNVLAAYDGADRDGSSYEGCRGCKSHAFTDIRPNCICTAVGPGYSGATNYDYSGKSNRYSSTSYDWFSKTTNRNRTTGCNDNDATYKDESMCKEITLSHYPGGQKDGYYGSRETDKPLAHLGENRASIGYGCCPNLTGRTNSSCVSDIRLKNVGDKFTAGLDEIKKLRIYNFTFKNDENKIPQVGVIAQELKVVFPQAVSKNAQGHYTIRWDEMFYAVVNAVKTLNAKIDAIASKIATDKERVATLKKDNATMYAQLDSLAKELEVLEAKKK